MDAAQAPGHLAHLQARDTSLVLVSRAPLDRIEAFKARMGWTIPWYSSFGSDFNYDFHVTSDEAGGSRPGLPRPATARRPACRP
jgi:predicted dithiol-disulfide oxidoreductase (DUF899 family)